MLMGHPKFELELLASNGAHICHAIYSICQNLRMTPECTTQG